ncbi:lytic murein transglycosylase [Aurantivibrio plasticivorans]
MKIFHCTKPAMLAILCLLMLRPITAVSEGVEVNQPDSFEACILRLQAEGRELGINSAMLSLLSNVQQIKRTITLDRNQPEFVQTFSGYYLQRVNTIRIRKGRDMLQKHRAFLGELLREYGVPPQYLVSFWALESNFGRNVGNMPTLDTLATLACDQRRSDYFSTELFAALRVMEQHQIKPELMQGSWAGAVGQTQFMPSVFLQHGVDGDDDGAVDLWRSEKDALRSAANYLSHIGWQRELRWGREVRLPRDFQYHLAGINNPQTLSYWRDLGITKVDGKPVEGDGIVASLIIPSGEEGPKFLVYDNFHVIMKWNRSQFYALAVGILADRINGAGTLYAEPPKSEAMTKQQVLAVQQKLKDLGFDPGDVDGVLGPATAMAVRQYQYSISHVADGFVDYGLMSQLGLR